MTPPKKTNEQKAKQQTRKICSQSNTGVLSGKTGMDVDSQEFFLQVLLEPFNIVVRHTTCNQEVSRPYGEHQHSMKSCVIVFMCHLDTSSTEPCDVHDPIISEDIILTCQNVGLGQRV